MINGAKAKKSSSRGLGAAIYGVVRVGFYVFLQLISPPQNIWLSAGRCQSSDKSTQKKESAPLLEVKSPASCHAIICRNRKIELRAEPNILKIDDDGYQKGVSKSGAVVVVTLC
jgi:hypothetical protein